MGALAVFGRGLLAFLEFLADTTLKVLPLLLTRRLTQKENDLEEAEKDNAVLLEQRDNNVSDLDSARRVQERWRREQDDS